MAVLERDWEDWRKGAGVGVGVSLLREKGLRSAFSEDTTLADLFPGVVKGDEATELGSDGVYLVTCRWMLRGRGGTGQSSGSRGKRWNSYS